jgi:tRNA(Arg) A34 adenosine deaminase TadA
MTKPQHEDSFDTAFENALGAPPPDVEGPLKERWSEPLGAVATLPPLELPEGHAERHRIYSLLLLALIAHHWTPLKRGRRGHYPWSGDSDGGTARHYEYLGHNIAALGVDGNGRILDFEFNHNAIFDSSAEHAEVRLVRRLYSLAHVSDSWSPVTLTGQGGTVERPSYVNLSDVTIYTSLESCSQCAGAMMLAQVKEIVYLQTDPDMFWIGRILRNLSSGKLRAPLPIAAAEIGLRQFAELDAAYSYFKREVCAERPFFVPDEGEPDVSASLTSFLCTEEARAIFQSGAEDHSALVQAGGLEHPDYRPADARAPLTNREVVAEADDFLTYAINHGSRATPHG